MSDSLPEDAWVSSFLPSPPRPLLNSLQKRLAASTSHVTALADLYKQRAAIEQQYADALAKLARTAENGGLIPKNGTEWERGGGEGKIWENVVSDLAETSTSHSTLAAMLRTDFEQPIRELPSKIIAWRRIGEQDSSLDKTLKDYEKTAGKLEKAKKGKADQYQSELNQLTQSISSLCPMVYTTYQRLDEQRLKSLKEIVVRWGTIQGDMAVREGERAERAVGNMLGWEPADEVLAVGTRLGGSAGSGGRGGSVAPSIASMPSMDRRVSAASDFSPRPSVRQNGSSSNVSSPAPPSSFGGGLKSMLGRSKTLARNRSSSNAASTRTGRDDPVESISEDRTEPQPERTERAVDQDGFSVPPPDRHRSLWEEPDEEIPMPKSAPIVPSKSDSLAPPIEPAPATPNSAPFAQTFESSPTGSQEALSKPKLNLAINTAPIEESEEERQAALQKMQQTLQLPPSQPSRRNTTRGRRDVRNTMFGMPGAVHTEEPDIMSTPNGTRGNNPFESPALAAPTLPVASGPGLRANITEAINVIMRAGEIKRLQITGEIHMGVQAAHGPIHIRLDAFERLEKIAPNPQYLSQVPDTPGEYILNSEHLSSATAGPKGTLLFKYQVHVSADDQKSVLPLFLEPAFQIKDGETRMILNHRTASAHTLSSLALVAMFEPGPNVPDVKTKPSGGVWSNSTRRMTWNVGTLQQGDGKIIAKFTNELPGALTPIGVQASWAVEGQLASGIGIQVVDGRLEEVTKGLVTGKYLAEAVIT